MPRLLSIVSPKPGYVKKTWHPIQQAPIQQPNERNRGLTPADFLAIIGGANLLLCHQASLPHQEDVGYHLA
jgi:hypothetical protein